MTERAGDSGAKAAFRRRVFYIPGYDPIHPRRYRELYRKEGADQARISGYALDLKPKTTKGPYGWHVTATMDGRAAEADVEVLVWSDIVRDTMSQSIPGTYLQLVRTAWAYIGSGALFRLMRLRKGPIIAALYPIFALLAQLGLAVVAGHLAGLALAALAGLIPVGGDGSSRIGARMMLRDGAYLLALFAVAALVLRWFRAKDGRFFAYYLMHDYAYSAQFGGANPPELEARMAEFGAAVRAALDGDWDEVLVIGHSSGAHLGVSILADLIRAGLPAAPAGGRRPALAFLSLGQVVPMVSFLPRADRLRADLHFLAARDELTWVDVTAPGDGCAFALCDPVAVSGVAPAGQKWPLVISAAFTQTLSPERWAELRWRFFRLHFQYLCAFDRVRDYDYFQITAGPVSLAERFRGRPPSKSRIDRAVNLHVGMAA
ncbi:hypothetical protein E7811_17275 [Aliigemmobacter aestuarii]|uniref:Alpha/beta hydrolase n=1 Tax=Aliigemmobacter aestuarii TaxID=1445661 RepID=A0A4S3MJF2_9RHOB|nr:hypothetical protein [Gemmobacter aestuarii]THD81219.1 hypothetical protein E7811_17275 [Gemmobacter aestuarii]